MKTSCWREYTSKIATTSTADHAVRTDRSSSLPCAALFRLGVSQAPNVSAIFEDSMPYLFHLASPSPRAPSARVPLLCLHAPSQQWRSSSGNVHLQPRFTCILLRISLFAEVHTRRLGFLSRHLFPVQCPLSYHIYTRDPRPRWYHVQHTCCCAVADWSYTQGDDLKGGATPVLMKCTYRTRSANLVAAFSRRSRSKTRNSCTLVFCGPSVL